MSARGAIADSTFTGNRAVFGGAVEASSSTLAVRGSTFDANQATADGGALAINTGQTTLSNVTLTNNVADTQGGALAYNYGGSSSIAPLILENVTISRNQIGRAHV